MWTEVERELSELLCSKAFPALIGLPAYKRLLKPNGQPDPIMCKLVAHELVHSTDLKSGIREFGSRERPKAREWAKPICRAVSLKNNPNGAWWFDEELVERWARNYPPGTPSRKQIILDSIRPMLAVCLDWNDFTDLRIMRPASSIPVITGQGAHKPIVQSPADPRYKSNVFLIGGFTQVFLPFVNPSNNHQYNWH
jgi:hypothetical protein